MSFKPLRILVVGKNGQVGWELMRSLLPLGEVIGTDRESMDLSRPETLAAPLRTLKPDVVVNAAAYTAVDRAESEEALATKVNGESPGVMARACADLGAFFVHYSTDYVFDGGKSTPYLETDPPNPKSAYGRSKLAGEVAVRDAGGRSMILRTAWVYGARGKNFLLTMLRLARERDELRVVADQFGSPTWSRFIAEATARVITSSDAISSLQGSRLLHLGCAGNTSWHEFATKIVARGAQLGLCREVPVQPIATSDYPTPALRPRYSQLGTQALSDETGCVAAAWDNCLELCLADLASTR